VKKTTVYLEPEVDAALVRLAQAEGVTKAEVIRRALRGAAASAPRPRIGIGVAESKEPPLDHDHLDEYLGKLIGDEYDETR
jgi:hypothetical protein